MVIAMACNHYFYIRNHRTGDLIKAPCGKCLPCRIAQRSKMEICTTLELQSVYSRLGSASFVTLTYDDEHLPSVKSPDTETHRLYTVLRKFCDSHHIVPPAENSTLRKVDAQNFMKRFRRYLDYYYPKYYDNHEVKFILVGEYGGSIGRPHMHLCLFDVDSSIADKICKKAWNKGIVQTGPLVQGGLRYVLDYIDSKVVGSESNLRYEAAGIEKPFMSHSSQFGLDYVFAHLDEIKELNGCIIRKGKLVPLPKSIRDRFGWYDIIPDMINQKRNDLALAKNKYGYTDYRDFDKMQSFVKEQMAVDACRQAGKTGVSTRYLKDINLSPQSVHFRSASLAASALQYI